MLRQILQVVCLLVVGVAAASAQSGTCIFETPTETLTGACVSGPFERGLLVSWFGHREGLPPLAITDKLEIRDLARGVEPARRLLAVRGYRLTIIPSSLDKQYEFGFAPQKTEIFVVAYTRRGVLANESFLVIEYADQPIKP